MKHWSVDITELKKDSRAYTIWKLEQMINFGIGEGKIKLVELEKYWDNLDLDPYKRKFLQLVFS